MVAGFKMRQAQLGPTLKKQYNLIMISKRNTRLALIKSLKTKAAMTRRSQLVLNGLARKSKNQITFTD